MLSYDIVIIGMGPAGIFAVKELLKDGKRKILWIDAGEDLDKRNPKDVLYGFSGAGAFSDGKLTLASTVGGDLAKKIGNHSLNDYIKKVDDSFIEMGATKELSGDDSNDMKSLEHESLKNNLQLVSYPVRHMGSDGNRIVMGKFREYFNNFDNIEMLFGIEACKIKGENNKFIVTTKKYDIVHEVRCKKVIVAMGRGGGSKCKDILEGTNAKYSTGRVDIGIRLEAPRFIFDEVTNIVHDPKLFYRSSLDDALRTFCVNPGGYVSIEENKHVTGTFYTINGYSNKDEKTDMTNMAILCSSFFTDPFDNAHDYGYNIAQLANLLGKKAIVQRYVDFKNGRRSTPDRIKRSQYAPTLKEAIPGDISFALPYRQFVGIIEMIEALNGLCPGLINSDSTYMYSTEVKFYGNRYILDNNMESGEKGLYVVGDCSGWTRGIIQAGVSGILAAEGIING